jgi:hypothetical protein
MQADLASYRHGRIHHSTIVTARDSNGNLYLTYHSSKNENKPYSQFMHDAGEGTRIYGWDVN